MSKAEKIYENSYVIDDHGVRVFILVGEEKALVVDTGFGDLDVRALAEEVTNLPLELLNTHGDMDHVSGNAAFSEFYMHPAEGCVYNHSGRATGTMIPVYDGTILDLGGRKLQVLHVPGHTPGSITLLDEEHRCLIGGDPIQKGGEIYMFGPYRDMESYIIGLEHLMEKEEFFDYIYPSHAEMPVEKEMIPKLIQGAKDILAGRVQATEKEMHAFTVKSYETAENWFLCD